MRLLFKITVAGLIVLLLVAVTSCEVQITQNPKQLNPHVLEKYSSVGLPTIYLMKIDEHEYIIHHSGAICHHEGCSCLRGDE